MQSQARMQAGLVRVFQLEVRVLNDAEDVAPGINDCANYNSFAHILQIGILHCAQFQQSFVFRLGVQLLRIES
jgi:hypothetical protein